VLLFQKRFHAGLVDGSIQVTVRQWDRPHVRVGGRYRVHPIGVVEVDAVEQVPVRELSEADAKSAGFSSRAELLAYMKPAAKGRFGAATRVFRIRLHHGGDGDRVEIALDDQLSPEDCDRLRDRLAKMDSRGPKGGRGPWTRAVLALIEAHPRTAASQLALKVKRPTLDFKDDVRKLKRLGLTQSFEVGYEVSPRGRAFLTQDAQDRPPSPKARARAVHKR
jgi:hypothetical protein